MLWAYYGVPVRVNEGLYRQTGRVAWPSPAAGAAVVLLICLDTVLGAFERGVLVVGLVDAGVSVLAGVVQLLAVSSRNGARFVLQVLGDGE